MVVQIGRFNVIAAALAAGCLVFWAWQIRPQPVSAPHYNFSFALRPSSPDVRAGPPKSDRNAIGPSTQDRFHGEVVSPDGDDQDSSSGDDDGGDDNMNPDDAVYPI